MTKARESIDSREEFQLIKTASLYESEPWGDTNQGPFLNSALLIGTSLSPGDLLAVIKKLERSLDRTESRRWGPREIDIDILLYDEIVVDLEDLVIPHPQMLNRSFAFLPAREVCPKWKHPIENATLMQLTKRLVFERECVLKQSCWWL